MPQNIINTSASWFPLSALEARSVIETKKIFETKKRDTLTPRLKPHHERVNISRFFIKQFEEALLTRAREEEKFWLSGELSKSLAKHVTQLHSQIIAALDLTIKHKKSGAAPTLHTAKSLLPLVKSFKLKCNHLIYASSEQQLLLALCLLDLCDDIEHYVTQIKITYSVVFVRDKKILISNRHQLKSQRALYKNIIQTHQSLGGPNSFPKPSVVRKEMIEAGHIVAVRTLNLWKNQLKNNTFDFYMQPQNRQ